MTNKTPPQANTPRRLFHTRPMRLRVDNNSSEARIDIVPLIDIIFCILTFFILASLNFSRQQAIRMDIPKASTGTPQMREMLMVSLDDFGRIYIEKNEVRDKNQLFQTVKSYQQNNPSGLMVLYASRNASYNEVVQVLDVLRQVGGEKVALATLPGEAESLRNQNSNGLSPNVPLPPANNTPSFPTNPSDSNSFNSVPNSNLSNPPFPDSSQLNTTPIQP